MINFLFFILPVAIAQLGPLPSFAYNIPNSFPSSTKVSFATSISMPGGATENFGYTVNAGPGSSALNYNVNLSSGPGASTFDYGTSGFLASNFQANGMLTPDSSQSLTAAQINYQVNSFVQNAYTQGINRNTFGSGSTYSNFNAFSTLNFATQTTIVNYSGATPTNIA